MEGRGDSSSREVRTPLLGEAALDASESRPASPDGEVIAFRAVAWCATMDEVTSPQNRDREERSSREFY